jgi:hypothetical protein
METFDQKVARVLAEEIELVPYDARWPDQFLEEKQRLLQVALATKFRNDREAVRSCDVWRGDPILRPVFRWHSPCLTTGFTNRQDDGIVKEARCCRRCTRALPISRERWKS